MHRQLKRMRRVLAWTGEHDSPVTVPSWVGAATRYLLLKRGVIGNAKISAREEEILQSEVVVRPDSAKHHHAMINFWRTTVSCAWHFILAVDRLDFRQRCDGDDRRGDLTGDAFRTRAWWRLISSTALSLLFPSGRSTSWLLCLLPAKSAAAVPEPGGDVLLYRD
ncbi:hypothetical protein ACLK2H_18225 [Escherichia coli]